MLLCAQAAFWLVNQMQWVLRVQVEISVNQVLVTGWNMNQLVVSKAFARGNGKQIRTHQEKDAAAKNLSAIPR